MDRIILKAKEDRRLRQGHLWVFSNEIAEKPREAGVGDLVEVYSREGLLLGTALYHPHSLIAARLLGKGVARLDHDFFRERLRAALALRSRIFPEELSYRLVHGESDFLPGLIVDRYQECLVVQTLAAGMDQRLDLICDALEELLSPAAIVERNDSSLRRYEELPERSQVRRGSCQDLVLIQENGIQYGIDLLQGQKTGFYLDQKLNRRAAARYCPGQKVLDCFCSEGGFSLNAARAGAGSVLGVDVSGSGLARARANAARNQLSNVEFLEQDVFAFLQERAAERNRFGVIILDPPSFARSKKDVPAARKAYRRINELACGLLEPGGILASACCSFQIFEDVFLKLIQEAALRAGRRLRLLEWRHQSPDHPMLPGMPETHYLKMGIFQVVPEK